MYTVYCDGLLIYDSRLDEYQITNAKLHLELNKTGSFSFVIYPSHPNFAFLKKLKSIVEVFDDEFLIFRGRILNDEQGFYNEKQVTCEGELAFLVDSIQRPYDFLSGENHTTVEELFTYFITQHNSQVDEDHQFIVGEITVSDPNDYVVRADSSYPNTLDSIKNKLIDSYGGYLQIRHEANGNYIDYLTDFDVLSSQKIEFGENLLDINRIAKGEDIATVIVPLGAQVNDETGERLTVESVNDGMDYVMNAEAVALYGKISKVQTWDDVTVAENLLRKANEYLASTVNLLMSIELNAADISSINPDVNSFHLGTYVKVKTNPHNIDSNFLVEKLDIDIQNPAANKLTLGKSYLSFTEQTQNTTRRIDTIKKEILDTTEGRINGSIAEVETELSSSIEQTSEQIKSEVSEKYYLKEDTDRLIGNVSTTVSQNKNSVDIMFQQFSTDLQTLQTGTDAQFSDIRKYIRFVDGNIILGVEGNELILKLQNDRIAFLENNSEIAYWQNRKFYAVDGEFIDSIKIGKFAFIPRTNGNLSFKKVVQ